MSSGLGSRLLSRARRYLTRQRWGAPLLGEWDRWRLLRVIERRGLVGRPLLVPADVAAALPAAVAYTHTFQALETTPLDGAVLQTDALQTIGSPTLRRVRQQMACTYLGGRYALFEPHAAGRARDDDAVATLLARLDGILAGEPAHRPADFRPARGATATLRRAILVTTYARPGALQRSLPQIAALGAPVLVVDDGSPPAAAEANRAICAAAGATYLALPLNAGLPTAANVGLSLLMADPAVRWISYFQDDVDVRPDTLELLIRLEDADARPILTGHDAFEHPSVDEVEIAGIAVKRKRSSPALHLHAHAEYWAGVMPLPRPYLGAPKPGAGASMEDWWIVNQAPRSAERRGLLVVCIPGLVRTFLWHHDDSTWANPRLPDPPLR
ncbi:MAG: glycosyltransferase [Candidatus Rokuibacteriota bacterium]|nr:MAG: glycosyltransferase [Candidatus Rokubacteria bacterium]